MYYLYNIKDKNEQELLKEHLEEMNARSILIIDDEKELCLLLENFLAKKTRSIDYSNSLETGVEKFKKMNPDLLILDHNLPDGNGIDNISVFKKLNKSLRIIIISAMSNLRNEALEKGADFFIEKPISFSQLKSILAIK
ncbi:MAG: response regulator [Bacteroidetes bacterium]|jgi:DNA-binding response OmpR family regulator|nr:response regulator [Bacteroidota bacterium]